MEARLQTAQDLASIAVADLGILANCRKGLPTYYLGLLQHRDEGLRVAAMAALLELGALPPEHWSVALEMSVHGAVKARAVAFFAEAGEHDLAEGALRTPGAQVAGLRERRLAGRLAHDHEELLEVDTKLFMAEGSIEHLINARSDAEQLG